MIKCSHKKVKDDISCCEHALVVDIGNIACNAASGMCQHQCPCAPKAEELAASQRLKAEIAEVVERLQRAYAMRESPDVLDCISELRQLSAV